MKLRAKLVVIAANVEPALLVVPLPSLCVQHNIPYCIVSDKAWLGKFVHKKTATCISIREPKAQFKSILSNLATICKTNYNDQYSKVRLIKGTSVLSKRAQTMKDKKEKIRLAEIEKSKRVIIE